MVFDIAAYNAERSGVDLDKGLPVTFYWEAEKDEDGKYVNVAYIRIWMSKNSEIVRKVSESDKKRFADRWQAFQKGEEMPEEGTPINLVPFATPANISSCKAERILTAEQLVETPDDRLSRAYLQNFKYQVRDWLASNKDANHIKKMRETIEKQAAQIEALMEEIQEIKSVKEPKKPGRPRKNVNASTDD